MNMHPGDIVFDKADPRHVGVIRGTSNTGKRRYAMIEWLETGWKSHRIPFSDLRLVRPESTHGRNVFKYLQRRVKNDDAQQR